MVKRQNIALFLLIFISFPVFSQNLSEELRRAENLHNDYEFDAAIAGYDAILKKTEDSTLIASIMQKKVLSENGINMLLFSTRPVVVARKTVAADNFFLYYSHLTDGEWVRTPNAFAQGGTCPTFFNGNAQSIVFAAPDAEGRSKLMTSTLGPGDVWSLPKVVESCASEGNEVFPMVSASGKELYFSSDAMAGMGGYDIYVCKWNDRRKCWDAPENLGFPFSSTGDDFLFSNTPDGEFSIFASNRDCNRGSMTIYALRFENSPVKKPVESAEEARAIAALVPAAAQNTAGSVTENDEVKTVTLTAQEKAHNAAVLRLEALKEEIRNVEAQRRELRSEKEISANESRMMDLQRRIGPLSDSITKMDLVLIEMGIVPSFSAEKTAAETSIEPVRKISYKFTPMQYGTMPQVQVEQPVVEEDPYEFSIGGETVLMTSLPDGIIYQIQVGLSSSKMKAGQFKGISPAFSKRQPSGKFLHTVGAFRTYAEATGALAKVKKNGFPSAYVIAFKDGKSITVGKARSLE